MLNVTTPRVIMLNVTMLNVTLLNVTVLNVTMLRVIMLNVTLLRVIMLNVTIVIFRLSIITHQGKERPIKVGIYKLSYDYLKIKTMIGIPQPQKMT